MKNFIAIAILTLVGALGVSAQTYQGEVNLGYKYLRSNVDFKVTPVIGFDETTDSHGVEVGYTRYTKGSTGKAGVFGLTGQAAVNFNSNEATMVTLMAGPQLKARNAHFFQPYARGMVGVAVQHFNPATLPTPPTFDRSNTSVAFDVGAGVDWKVSPNFSVRTGADYLNTSFGGSRQNNVGISLGVVF